MCARRVQQACTFTRSECVCVGRVRVRACEEVSVRARAGVVCVRVCAACRVEDQGLVPEWVEEVSV